jgi:hypothetical protein
MNTNCRHTQMNMNSFLVTPDTIPPLKAINA